MKMVAGKVSILLTAFIFGMIVHAWCDSVKSVQGTAIQLTAVKMDGNKATLQKETEPAKKSATWFKKNQAKSRDVNFVRTLEEKKRSRWVESPDNVLFSYPFLENVWRSKFFSSPQANETKPSGSNLSQPIFKPYPDEEGYLEGARILTALKFHRSKDETLKEIFMGFRFSFDLTHGHVLLEMNVTPSSEIKPGLTIRF